MVVVLDVARCGGAMKKCEARFYPELSPDHAAHRITRQRTKKIRVTLRNKGALTSRFTLTAHFKMPPRGIALGSAHLSC
jgi:hypothetical protein